MSPLHQALFQPSSGLFHRPTMWKSHSVRSGLWRESSHSNFSRNFFMIPVLSLNEPPIEHKCFGIPDAQKWYNTHFFQNTQFSCIVIAHLHEQIGEHIRCCWSWCPSLPVIVHHIHAAIFEQLTPFCDDLLCHTLPLTGDKFQLGCTSLPTGNKSQVWCYSVSYTHLDVYKRQTLSAPLRCTADMRRLYFSILSASAHISAP